MKYTIQKAYGTTSTGRMIPVWNVVEMVGTVVHVVDTFSLKRDAKYYAEKWSKE